MTHASLSIKILPRALLMGAVALFLLGGAACGSSGDAESSADAGQSPDGAPAGDGGSAASGGSGGGAASGGTGGEAGSGGSSGSSGSSGGGADAGVPACEAQTMAGDTCDSLDARCQSDGTCCRCIDFQAASCGLQWDCAVPANNESDCPADPPTEGSSCTLINVTCQFCTSSGPAYLRCSRIEAGSSEGEWGSVEGLTCSG